MDDLGSREGAEVRGAIEAAGVDQRFFTPCSPDSNLPLGICRRTRAGQWIEDAFAKLKSLLSKVADQTSVTLRHAFTSRECRNDFAMAGDESE